MPAAFSLSHCLEELVPGLSRLGDACLLKQVLVVEVTDNLAFHRGSVNLAVAAVGSQRGIRIQCLPVCIGIYRIGQVNCQILGNDHIKQIVAAAVNNRREIARAKLYLDLVDVVLVARNVFLLDLVLACVLLIKFLNQFIAYRSGRIRAALERRIVDGDHTGVVTALCRIILLAAAAGQCTGQQRACHQQGEDTLCFHVGFLLFLSVRHLSHSNTALCFVVFIIPEEQSALNAVNRSKHMTILLFVHTLCTPL